MNTETISIKEGDKLIAEFMGYKYIPDGDTFYNKEDMYFSDQLEYHSSWDWLMPVVEKIESLGHYTNISRNEDLNSCYIFKAVPTYKRLEEDLICFTDFKYDNKIEAVYNTVIEFINWYNQNKNNIEILHCAKRDTPGKV